MQQLAYRQSCVEHDHGYCSVNSSSQTKPRSNDEYKLKELVDDLYTHHVKIGSSSIQELEASARGQSTSRSDKWFNEQKLRITASIMKEVCHHRPTTSCEAFIKKKLSCNPIDVTVITYGRNNEHTAIATYADHQKINGKIVQVESCGMFVDCCNPRTWFHISFFRLVPSL